MKKLKLVSFVLLLFNINSVIGQSNYKRIQELIAASVKLNVDNPSSGVDGDVIVPTHSLGFSGVGASRVQNFEQDDHLTKVFEQYVAFNPNADALFPGSLIQGSSLVNGVLNPINAERTPITITVSDLVSSDPNTTYSEEVKDPSLATTTGAISKILSQKLNVEQPAKISYSETVVHSLEEGFLKLGASFSWMSNSIGGSFSTSTSNLASSYMVRFVQSYYTVTCEPPSSPASFISWRENYKDFRIYADALKNPPTYISSVTYGRELWLLIQSNSDSTAVITTLNAAFGIGFASGKTDLSQDQKNILNQSTIQIYAIGGGGPAAVKVITGDKASGIKAYLLAGANYSKNSPGAIISYTARYLKDNDVARVSSSTDYKIMTSVSHPSFPVTAMQVEWRTTGDNKDWNTQAVVDVNDATGRHIAHIDCCSADRNGDQWNAGSDQTRNLTILVPGLTLDQLAHGSFTGIRNPHGNDDWDYTATIWVITSDGQRKNLATASGRNTVSTSW